MAKLTGGGFTNLPADRDTLVEKLERLGPVVRPARQRAGRRRPLHLRAREIPNDGEIRGTCQVFGQVGVVQPFYSYLI